MESNNSQSSYGDLPREILFEIYDFLDTETLANSKLINKYHKDIAEKKCKLILKEFFPHIDKINDKFGYNCINLLRLARSIKDNNVRLDILNEVIKHIFNRKGWQQYYLADITEEMYKMDKIYLSMNNNMFLHFNLLTPDGKETQIFTRNPESIRNLPQQEKHIWIENVMRIMKVFCKYILPLFANIKKITISDEEARFIIENIQPITSEKITYLKIDEGILFRLKDIKKFPNLEELHLIQAVSLSVSSDLLHFTKLHTLGICNRVVINPAVKTHEKLEKIIFHFIVDVEYAKSKIYMFKIREIKDIPNYSLEATIDK